MEFVVVGFILEVADYVLPVGGEDVFVGSVKTLVDLCMSALVALSGIESRVVRLPKHQYRILLREHSLAPRAVVVSK